MSRGVVRDRGLVYLGTAKEKARVLSIVLEGYKTEDAVPRGRRLVRGEKEVRGAPVRDSPGGSAVGEGRVVWVGFWNCDYKRLLVPGSVVECGKTGSFVGNPPRTAGASSETPSVDEVSVDRLGGSGDVCIQVELCIAA